MEHRGRAFLDADRSCSFALFQALGLGLAEKLGNGGCYYASTLVAFLPPFPNMAMSHLGELARGEQPRECLKCLFQV